MFLLCVLKQRYTYCTSGRSGRVVSARLVPMGERVTCERRKLMECAIGAGGRRDAGGTRDPSRDGPNVQIHLD